MQTRPTPFPRLALATFIFGYPHFAKWYWPIVTDKCFNEWGWSKEKLWAIVAFSVTWVALFYNTLIFVPLYYFKIEWFEQYKCFQNPWPWEVDKARFKEMLKESLTLLFTNNFCICMGITSF